MNIELEMIKNQAKAEFKKEKIRKAVDNYKEKLRKKRPLIDIIFPWKITITRKEKL